MALVVVVICRSDEDRRAVADVLPNDLRSKGFCVRKLAGRSEPWTWRWVGKPSEPRFSAPPKSSDRIGVAIPYISKTERDTVVSLATTRESILGVAPVPCPSDVLETDWK